jgi:cysteine-rich repeat protein
MTKWVLIAIMLSVGAARGAELNLTVTVSDSFLAKYDVVCEWWANSIGVDTLPTRSECAKRLLKKALADVVENRAHVLGDQARRAEMLSDRAAALASMGEPFDLRICGDGELDTGETCDEGGETATCDDDCTDVVCGDSVLNQTAGEECDDGGTVPGDGCSATCTIE